MDTGEIIKLAAWNHFILYEVSKRQLECPNIEYNLGGQIEYDRIQKLVKSLTWSALLIVYHGIVWILRQSRIVSQTKSILGPLHRAGGGRVHPTPDFQINSIFPKSYFIQNLSTALSPTVVVVSVGSLVNLRPSTTQDPSNTGNNHMFIIFTSTA